MPSEPEQFEGRYGDGKTAASKLCRVRVDAAGLEIAFRDGGKRRWPLAEVEALTALDRKRGDVVVRRRPVKGAPVFVEGADFGATLFVAAPGFSQALATANPRLTAHSERWRYTKPAIAVAVAVTVGFGALWAIRGDPARQIADLVPQAWWTSLGEHVIGSITAGRTVCSAPEGQAALGRLMAKLSVASGSTKEFNARVVDWSLVNAFAVPGGKIVVTRGLIGAVGGSDELAGVIAHEIGHGLERHPESSLVRSLGLSVLTSLLFGGGTETFAGIGTTLLQLRYTRDAEREADQRAVETMRTARIPARALGDFFTRLKAKESEREAKDGRPVSGNSRGPQILSTHPTLEERVEAVRRLPTYPTEPATTVADFEALKRMCVK